MNQLSISPIFPPRENFFIGDIYLTYSTGPTRQYPKGEANRPAIWLDSMPIDTVSFYSSRPGFAASQVTYTSMPDGSQLWQQPNEVIQAPNQSNSARLRVVAFPAFNFASVTTSSLGLNVPGSTVGALFGFSSSDNLTISISVPAAESYSVPAIVALRAFLNRCQSNPDFEYAYSIASKTLYNEGPETQNYTPVIILVNEVFYARAIDFTYTSKSGAGAKVSATLGSMVNLTGQISAVEQQLKTLNGSGDASNVSGGSASDVAPNPTVSGGAPSATATSAAPSATSVAATQTQVESLTDDLKSLQDQLNQAASAAVPSAPGATASVVSASDSSVTMRETFSRPVAIGYRALDLTAVPNTSCTFGGVSIPFTGNGAPIPVYSPQ